VTEAIMTEAIKTESIKTASIKEMTDYILRELVRRPGVEVTPDTPLVSSGLIDWFALVEIFVKLEKLTNRRIPAAKIQPKDMDTVSLMFATAERIGKPRQ
jgi:acyl carrier protein